MLNITYSLCEGFLSLHSITYILYIYDFSIKLLYLCETIIIGEIF
jgi:hypothetical protein